MITDEATLEKRGGGRGTMFPKEMCDTLEVESGEKTSLVFDEAAKTIRIENPNSLTVHALMPGYEGPKPKPGEIDAPGPSVGKELW